jgi:putative FmdB family regulatory protein
MPIYEYRCGGCKKKVTLFYQTFSAAENGTKVCPECQSPDLKRLVSRVFQVKSEESRLDDLGDMGIGDVDENDPASMARWAKKMGKEFGEGMGDDWEEMVDRMASGDDLSEDGEGDAAGDSGDL